ncbi:DinB family protein [Gracilibacillus sp. S3-1-1]|uniref:DinB family protein n=1 Tax=Gracilibacillus pellucidus TaxID=3095368 RepID=A0ACC6M0D7_9BACI|nr:DinB family protein [Gracilibacillus sp. S3-1-1]MDX8044398.1 DinB family protein [Gracilibacillus sp. S3-1-1]
MEKINETIQELAKFNEWSQSLQEVEDKYFFTPIKKGKWTPAEIISHITSWDRYILKELMPKMKENADIESVEFEVINQPAAEYALSGISKEQLLKEQKEARTQLIQGLKEKTEKQFYATFTLDGEELDAFSGYPHSMFNYINVFVWHDNHHKQQIKEFLTSLS